MARIYQRGNIWYLDIAYNGRRARKRVGTSKRMAELALKDAEVKVAKREFGFESNDISIESLIEKFLEYNRTNHRTGTTRRYKSVTDHLRRYLSNKRKDVVKLSQLTPEVIEGYKSFRRSEWVMPNGKAKITDYARQGARARTVNLELEGIKTMLNLASRWDYLKDNPMKKVKPLKVDDKKPPRFLSEEEYAKFLASCPKHLYIIYYTFLTSGMRKGELEHLYWRDIDFNNKKILIREKPDWKPKTGERDIPMSDNLHKVLSIHKQQTKNAKPDSYVFDVIGSGKSHNMLRTELIKVAQAADIEDFTKVHTLRHTFASHLIMSGVDLPSLQKLMGHADIETTMIYAHLAQNHLAKAVNALSIKIEEK